MQLSFRFIQGFLGTFILILSANGLAKSEVITFPYQTYTGTSLGMSYKDICLGGITKCKKASFDPDIGIYRTDSSDQLNFDPFGYLYKVNRKSSYYHVDSFNEKWDMKLRETHKKLSHSAHDNEYLSSKNSIRVNFNGITEIDYKQPYERYLNLISQYPKATLRFEYEDGKFIVPGFTRTEEIVSNHNCTSELIEKHEYLKCEVNHSLFKSITLVKIPETNIIDQILFYPDERFRKEFLQQIIYSNPALKEGKFGSSYYILNNPLLGTVTATSMKGPEVCLIYHYYNTLYKKMVEKQAVNTVSKDVHGFIK